MSSYQKRLKDIEELKSKNRELTFFQIVVKQYLIAKAENNEIYASQCLRAIRNKLAKSITLKNELEKIDIVLEELKK